MDIKFPTNCAMVVPDELVPYEKNPKNHNDKDIGLIIKSIQRNGWGDPILVCPETKEVLSGNGRLIAAKKMGLEKVPVVYAPEGLTEKQKADLVIASNKLVEVSDYNQNLDFLIGDFGLDPEDFGIEIPETESHQPENNPYEMKIDTPVYEITGEEPDISELTDTKKAEDLIAEIDSMDLPEKQKKFLKTCATRLFEFNYSKIAEYYAHQDPTMQGIMEKLALVIIDYNKAIENGFVDMTQKIEKLVGNNIMDYEEEGDDE